MKKFSLLMLAFAALLLTSCAQKPINVDNSESVDFEEESALTPDEQAARDIVGIWSFSSSDDDGSPQTNTYTFNEDGSLVETITNTYPNGTIKMQSEGKWKVRDNIIEFLYELDRCKAYIDGVIDDDATQALREENKQENLKVREYKEDGRTYGFPIVSITDDSLVLDVQGDHITLTKQ